MGLVGNGLRNVSISDSRPKVDRIWGIWGSYYNIPLTLNPDLPKAISYLLKGDFRRTWASWAMDRRSLYTLD